MQLTGETKIKRNENKRVELYRPVVSVNHWQSIALKQCTFVYCYLTQVREVQFCHRSGPLL